MRGAIDSAVTLTYGKLAIAGLEKEASANGYTHSTIISGCGNDPGDLLTFCEFNYGYPQANFATLPVLVSGISPIAGETEWYLYGFGVLPDSKGVIYKIKITSSNNLSEGALIDESCYLEYRNWAVLIDPTKAAPKPIVAVIGCE